MQFVFDLDGTLLDTEEAVRKAYIMAGVTPPANFFGRPAWEWMKDTPLNRELHKQKNRHYKETTWRMVTALPMLELFDRTKGIILTGASQEAARMLCEKFNIQPSKLLTCLSVKDKINWLNKQEEPGIYFDDDHIACETMLRNTRWMVCLVCK